MDEEIGGRQCNGKEVKSNVARLIETETVRMDRFCLRDKSNHMQFLDNNE